MSISGASKGSAARRWRMANSISPSADKGLITWGRALAAWEALRRRFLAEAGVAGVMATDVAAAGTEEHEAETEESSVAGFSKAVI